MYSATLNLIVPIYGEIGSLSQFDIWIREITNPDWHIKVVAVFDSMGTKKSNENLKHIEGLHIKNLEIIQGKFGSPGMARNAALKTSNAEWVIFCDADDLPKLDRILGLIWRFKPTKTDVIVGSFEIANLSDSSTKLKKFDENNHKLRNFLDVSSSPGIWRFIFKRESLAGLKFSDLKMGEDQLFLMEYFSEKRAIQFSDVVIYTYNQGVEGQLTGEKKTKREIVKCLGKSREILRRNKNTDFYSAVLLINMYFRQSISGLKYGNRIEKYISTGHLVEVVYFALKLMISNLRRKI
jgi:glycosyltransferase involved in cell wall biosynthesis